jgi:hypothetical protein
MEKRNISLLSGLRFFFILIGILWFLLFSSSVSEGGSPERSCLQCHASIDETLPFGHESVEGETIMACIVCHVPMADGKAEPNRFSKRIHQPHARKEVDAACTSCHVISVEGKFGLPGHPLAMNAPDEKTLDILKEIFNSWAESSYLDAIHANRFVTCSSCHGNELPALDDRPANDRCFECHGSYAELAAKTPGADFADRNPHASHLGDIACTVCHKAHEKSINYCLDCHKRFKMNPIPAGDSGM